MIIHKGTKYNAYLLTRTRDEIVRNKDIIQEILAWNLEVSDDLEVECKNQTGLYYLAGALCTFCEAEVRRVVDEKEEHYARRYGEAQKDLNKEAERKTHVLKGKAYQEILEKVRKFKYLRDVSENLKDSIAQKGYQLRNLTDLQIQKGVTAKSGKAS